MPAAFLPPPPPLGVSHFYPSFTSAKNPPFIPHRPPARVLAASAAPASHTSRGAFFTHHTSLPLSTQPSISLHDITPALKALLATLPATLSGTLTVTSPHTTLAITLTESEPRLVDDIRVFLRRLAPPELPYLHNDIHLRDPEGMEDPATEPRNAAAHLGAMVVGASLVVPVVEGRLAVGKWQSVVAVDLDGPRERKVCVTVMGAV